MNRIITASDGLGWRVYLHHRDQILGQVGAICEKEDCFLPYRVKEDGALINQNPAYMGWHTRVFVRRRA